MSDDQDRWNLTYIRDGIRLIRARTRGGREPFLNDLDIQDAVLWRLQTLAEAAGKLSQSIKHRHPDIPWRAVYGFRNVAAHGYLDLQLDRVWEIIDLHLPALQAVAEAEVRRHDASGPKTSGS